jgi:hypothetical protein
MSSIAKRQLEMLLDPSKIYRPPSPRAREDGDVKHYTSWSSLDLFGKKTEEFDNPKVSIVPSSTHGLGLMATADIKKGDVILVEVNCDYNHAMMDVADIKKRRDGLYEVFMELMRTSDTVAQSRWLQPPPRWIETPEDIEVRPNPPVRFH